MKGNMLIVHGGAPTAVINASLYGAAKFALEAGEVDHVYAAAGGSSSIISGNFIDLGSVPKDKLELLPFTPGSAIGTSRDILTEESYRAIAASLKERNIKWLLFTGGNGSMEACGKVANAVGDDSCMVVGIPKTIDNDIEETDHAPGFGSAARYLAASARDLCYDVASLPIHVSIIEAMGRNAGWLTASSILAKDSSDCGPHLILVPEVPFNEEAFLEQTLSLYKKYGGVVVVASEGLKDTNGTPIVPPIFKVGRSVYYGDVSAHLCNLVIQKLGYKARSEKPGIIGRASSAHQSEVDREEAILAGKTAAEAALSGKSRVMVGFKRVAGANYKVETILIPVEKVMLRERTLERRYISSDGMHIEQSFAEWCRPLIGSELPPLAPVGLR